MSSSQLLVLSLCLGVSAADFTNVTHLANAVIAFGSSTSSDGTSSFFPASDGNSVGVYESFDSGASLQYVDGVGATAEAMILMATATREAKGENMSVLVGGVFGSAISMDGGYQWEHLNLQEFYTQDVKYEESSGLYSLTGLSLGEANAALSSDGGNTFNLIPVTGLYNPDLRYGSYPTKDTFYVTAGIWPTTGDVEEGSHRITARLTVTKEGKLIQHKVSDTNTTNGFWCQVAKTTDGGASWTIVYEDFESGRYPNDIYCYDENTCVFTMEGETVVPQIVSTQDGGKTWTTFLDESGSDSLVAVRMVGPTEAYVSGGGDIGRMWHTTDLVNWSASTTAESDAALIFSFALTADQSTAYATGVLRSQICSMIKIDL